MRRILTTVTLTAAGLAVGTVMAVPVYAESSYRCAAAEYDSHTRVLSGYGCRGEGWGTGWVDLPSRSAQFVCVDVQPGSKGRYGLHDVTGIGCGQSGFQFPEPQPGA
ncbi:hypothetical protein ACFPZ0_07360 [Streptomonospora nanhaiensis]|uniref:Uncharacterized protein n=1 Tax=Streptomonospora nanhaiensis TaxID=1323731 RepID=A0A853BNR9_9ACTN|nr:hypothetical protein [Streptomonospora nanhaiensis]MBV2362277.1 hypothetical protein [Streptomonospora nanhaiensis]MBX9387854.1 hypothetical protein [Streptomonospora nanhaiensis]NYI97279.1 hypothetical protein [Streptomonospora nanhaiensis]